ncbi:MAG: Snf7 family protein, partial [Nitrosarchaeum sp.]
VVNAQKTHNNAYAQAYANELVQVRKMKNMVSGAKLSMEQIQLRLNTVSELGDVVVTLSPCMSLIKGLSPALSGIMPEASSSMQDLSQILGDVMSGSSLEGSDLMSAGNITNSDTLAILEEAHSVIAGQTKTSIPEIPDNLKQESAQRRTSDVLI